MCLRGCLASSSKSTLGPKRLARSYCKLAGTWTIDRLGEGKINGLAINSLQSVPLLMYPFWYHWGELAICGNNFV